MDVDSAKNKAKIEKQRYIRRSFGGSLEKEKDVENVYAKTDAVIFNWKRYHFYNEQYNGNNGINNGPWYDGYKMKYGYIWICKYYEFINQGIHDYSDISASNIGCSNKFQQKFRWCAFTLSMYKELKWNIQRLLWITHYKHDSKCKFGRLPKDIIKIIIDMLKIHIYEKFMQCPKKPMRMKQHA